MSITDITDSNAESILGKQGVVIVDFHASWCMPCKMMAPAIEELSDELTKVVFVKADTEECPETTKKYKITAVPTLVILKNGEEINRLVGKRTKDEIDKAIREVTNV